MASIGPSTITGIAAGGEQSTWSAPNSWAPLWNSGVSAVLRYFGPAAVGVGEVGVAAADEPENLAVVDDREDDPVAEPVDETAGAGDGGHPGGESSRRR